MAEKYEQRLQPCARASSRAKSIGLPRYYEKGILVTYRQVHGMKALKSEMEYNDASGTQTYPVGVNNGIRLKLATDCAEQMDRIICRIRHVLFLRS